MLEVREEMPQEITGSRRIQAVIYLILNKKLIEDMTNIKMLLIVIMHMDAMNCCNRVACIFESLSM